MRQTKARARQPERAHSTRATQKPGSKQATRLANQTSSANTIKEMQYPQIQFYRGSLVRLASGKLKQVEDLSSDDFLESARLIRQSCADHLQPAFAHSNRAQQAQANGSRQTNSRNQLDENNNSNSVFNSPEPTPSFDSPTMELMDMEDEEDEDEELDVVSGGDHEPPMSFNCLASSQTKTTSNANQFTQSQIGAQLESQDDLYIDSSVVKDFLEVGPPCSFSPISSSSSASSLPSTSTSTTTSASSRSSSSPNSPLVNPTVLIKFFLESSRSVVFIEVPIEHPFFVFHRGWSSWNPQRTYDKFGLKCRKLKIGDTCISLIRRQRKQDQQQRESDQCNILFSSIKIHE